MRAVALFVGGLAVGLGVQVGLAQSPALSVRMMNHVAFTVPDPEMAAQYYRDKMGYKEGFRNYDAEGRVSTIYMQISKETFLELNSPNPSPGTTEPRPLGFTHYGLWVDDTNAAVQMFRSRGLKVSDPRVSIHRPTPGAATQPGAVLANIEDPYMRRIELVQVSSQQQKAIDAWK